MIGGLLEAFQLPPPRVGGRHGILVRHMPRPVPQHPPLQGLRRRVHLPELPPGAVPVSAAMLSGDAPCVGISAVPRHPPLELQRGGVLRGIPLPCPVPRDPSLEGERRGVHLPHLLPSGVPQYAPLQDARGSQLRGLFIVIPAIRDRCLPVVFHLGRMGGHGELFGDGRLEGLHLGGNSE
jgi:hypothetical protein